MRPGASFEVLSNPEFLSEGTAIENLKSPDRILIGCQQTLRGRRAAAALVKIYSNWVPRSRILCTNLFSSELSKLVANAMLAQRISSINSISEICERTGANVHEVAKAVGLDPRIGPQFLKAGLGFGGSCFRKDIASLVYLARSLNLDDAADYWDMVNHMNSQQRNRFALNVIARLHTTLANKKIALLGFAFKKNTGDTRESLAVDVIRVLLEDLPGEIAIFDPGCSPAAIEKEVDLQLGKSLPCRDVVKSYADPYQACHDADAILVITDWDMFKNAPREATLSDKSQFLPSPAIPASSKPKDSVLDSPLPEQYLPEPSCPANCPECHSPAPVALTSKETLDWVRVGSIMKEPRWVFDGRGVVDVPEMEKLGFRVETLGVTSAGGASLF